MRGGRNRVPLDGEDASRGIAVDADGDAYVTGWTTSDERSFPVTGGPDLTFNGAGADYDAFVAKLKPDGSGLVYAGYVGGQGFEQGWGIAVDGAGSAHVTGWTASDQGTFAVNVGPDLTFNGSAGGGGDAFVARVSAPAECATAVAVLKGLRAVRQRAVRDHVDLSWDIDPAASAYNLWYVTRKQDIDLARQRSQPPAIGVAACSAPSPALGNSCTDLGAVSRGAPAAFFYQARAACDNASEGP